MKKWKLGNYFKMQQWWAYLQRGNTIRIKISAISHRNNPNSLHSILFIHPFSHLQCMHCIINSYDTHIEKNGAAAYITIYCWTFHGLEHIIEFCLKIEVGLSISQKGTMFFSACKNRSWKRQNRRERRQSRSGYGSISWFPPLGMILIATAPLPAPPHRWEAATAPGSSCPLPLFPPHHP
jgi:hypothetical protein